MKSAWLSLAFVLLAGASGAAQDSSPSPALPEPASAPTARAVPSAAADLERVLGELQREERGLQQRFDLLGKQASEASARGLARGRVYARLARAGLLPVGGGFRALVEHATRLERLRRGVERDLSEQKRATSERAAVAQKLAEIKARIAPLETEHEALARVESALLSADDRERAFQRAFENGASADHTAVYGALGPSDPAEIRAGFARMRGRLPFPIAGRSEIRPARRTGSEGPGLEMRAPLGTPVRAVYPGRVAFADSYADYGKTVIVDHGGRHYSVSANLGTIDVAVGDEVEVNTRLGTVGDVGRGALVYVEIRVGADTVDPSPWFGL
ncbi:MAG TPA: peptidoglycan DD-metalloendopeptidase family protein [Polyangiaceae bacterium]|jgi:murein DD-endopeptidase MepM/ murein hydrolase activator NlpD|nr:peptidoglycan DD-metalloendopeptidase family protein [Polyangiaceae bacterium]